MHVWLVREEWLGEPKGLVGVGASPEAGMRMAEKRFPEATGLWESPPKFRYSQDYKRMVVHANLSVTVYKTKVTE